MDQKPCGLLTLVPAALQNEWAANLGALTKLFRPAALIFKAQAPGALTRAIEAARPLELAILIADDLVTACNAGAAGVYFSTPDAPVAKARDALGSAAVIGAACGLSRHAAMDYAEAGADFIVFDASETVKADSALDIALWWDEVATVPAALAFGRVRPERSATLAARPDFLLIEETGKPGESLTFATEFGLQSQV